VGPEDRSVEGSPFFTIARPDSSRRDAEWDWDDCRADPNNSTSGPGAQNDARSTVVLIVEDHRDNREGLAEYLGAVGFTVAVADNGPQALTTATTLLPDVILMDLKLRGIDGWEVTRRLLADSRTCQIPIVAVSACVFPEDIEAAKHAGCVGFVAKPYDLQELMRTIERALDSGRR
jgi:two-component system cell cycle response regulator DivK